MSETGSKPIYTIDAFEHGYQEEGKIFGTECSQCHHRQMTQVLLCPSCGSKALKQIELATTGKVRSFTVQNVPSDEFLNDAPYGYALVDLDDGTVVSGWLPEAKSEKDIQIGDKVQWKKSYKVGLIFEKVQ
ncbi:MAG: OB-fold domain-containing protein [Candidatus Thermoplasmatota archaeon]|jgi:uncharacterized OB-fold protein|nr:OB-fold domain-containing protein [Candidatus Thermoplasmatota archaeon]